MNSIATTPAHADGKSISRNLSEEQLTLESFLDSFVSTLGKTQASTNAAIRDLTAQLMGVKSRVSESEWFEVIAPMCRAHKAAGILSEDPYTARALAKPRGFAGDAAMLDFIYSGLAPEGTSEVGRRLLQATSHSPSGLSVIDRRNRLTAAIRLAGSEQNGARVLAIACGHLREAQELTSRERSDVAEIIALDQDALAIELVEREQPSSQTTTVNGNVRDLIAGRIKFEGLDLVYAAGLFDYLSDAVCIRLLKKMIESLAPGGRLLVGNFAPANWGRAYMDTFMDWRLIYRTPSDLRELSRKASASRPVRVEKVYTDDHSNIAYLELVV
ncbi:MAG: trans-aconitate 2-methyltransferase [Myxococcota bacterium]